MLKKALILAAVAVVSLGQTANAELTHVGEIKHMTTVYEDTLVHIARDNNLGYIDIRAANPSLDPWIPGEGAEVVLPTMHLLPDADQVGVVINLPEMRLYHYEKKGEAPKTYPIGIGRDGLETPLGKTKIVRKKEGPTWTPTQRMLDEDPELKPFYPPGPENPLGTHALYLDWPLYRIHGTNKPYGIGRRVSSGCIRMYPEGVIDFYAATENGTQVNVIDQPIKAAWIDDTFYIEATPSIADADKFEQSMSYGSRSISQDDIAYIRAKAGVSADKLNWDLVRDVINSRLGYPIAVGKMSDTSKPKQMEDVMEEEKEAKADEQDVPEEEQASSQSQNETTENFYRAD